MRMGWTIAERILAKNALDGKDAMPGEILRARPDRVVNDAGGPLALRQVLLELIARGGLVAGARDERAARAASGGWPVGDAG